MVLKTKRNGNGDNIFFIDASKEFVKGKNQNELSQEHIQKIVDAYVKRENVPKYAYKATMDEIENNGYNLNIPRYVDTSEKEEEIDLRKVIDEISVIKKEKKALQAQIEETLKLLGIGGFKDE